MDYTPRWYGLRGTEVVPLDSIEEWGRMMQGRERIVKQEYVGNVFISTVFLGLDHSFTLPGEKDHIPLFFETMVFGGKLDQEIERYSTWQLAMLGHEEMVKRVKAQEG